MSIKRMPINDFVIELQKAEARKDGYIMGAKGQDPKKWSTSSWYFTQYKNRENYSAEQEEAALNWRKTAQRVWDCNGLAEGIYEDFSGVNINTDTDGKARYNYARWCSTKGTGLIPTQYRVPGAAVFWGSKASSITHVAYLEKPVNIDNPAGDWFIIEARGVVHGVVRTKLNTRKPKYWGLMTKYFDYEAVADTEITPVESVELGKRVLQKGIKGKDVEEMQNHLIDLGFDLGSDGADGNFGPMTEKAVKKFQTKYGLTNNGIFDKSTYEKLLEVKQGGNKKPEEEKPVEEKDYQITGGSVWIWDKHPSYGGKKMLIVYKGDEFEKPDFGNYIPITYNNSIKWVNKKYIKEI